LEEQVRDLDANALRMFRDCGAADQREKDALKQVEFLKEKLRDEKMSLKRALKGMRY
jgi:hypothetical protein